MQDAWRAYLELAMGLTEAPRKKAQDAVRRLVGTGGATAAQLQALAEELMSTSAANRESLTKLVRFEVDRALGAVGLATADEVAELTRRVHELERQLREARTGPVSGGGAAVSAAAGTGAAVGGPGVVVPGAAGERAGAVPGGAEPAAPPAAAAPTAGTSGPGPAKKAVAKKAIAKKAVKKALPATGGGEAAGPDAVAKKAAKTAATGGEEPAGADAVAKKAAKKAVAKKAVALRPSTDVEPAGEAPAPRPAKNAPRKQQPGGPA